LGILVVGLSVGVELRVEKDRKWKCEGGGNPNFAEGEHWGWLE
jgi:hypothetical protein